MQRLRPWGELGENLQRADQTLNEEESDRCGEEACSQTRAPRLAADDPERRNQDQAHDPRCIAVDNVWRGELRNRREDGAPHQWPVGVEESRVRTCDVRAEHQQRID